MYTVPPIFRENVEIERFVLLAVISECQILVGGGAQFGRKWNKYFISPTALNPDARPLGTYETKMAAVPVSARSSDDLTKNRGLWTVYAGCGACFINYTNGNLATRIWDHRSTDKNSPIFQYLKIDRFRYIKIHNWLWG